LYFILFNDLFSGQLDPEVYVNVLQEENTRLKGRVESLVKELVTLENQRGGRSSFLSSHQYKKILNSSFYSNTTI
jgi:hypothetical protein